MRRDVHEHLQKHHPDLHAKLSEKHKGGSLGSLLSDGWNTISGAANKLGSTISTGIKRGVDVLDSTAKAVGVQADVLGDKFLHAVGLRNQKKYQDAEVTDQMKFHARLNKSAYGTVDKREDVGDFKYLKDDSTDDYAVYSDGKKAYFTFRGTRPKEAITGQNDDLLEDGKIALGTTATMSGMNDARSRINKLLDRFGDHNVNLSGYSLGGGRMFEALEDSKLYSRLGEDNFAVAPGITHLNTNISKYANMDKVGMAFSHVDPVANSLMGHLNDRIHVNYSYVNPIAAHTTYLSDLAK